MSISVYGQSDNSFRKERGYGKFDFEAGLGTAVGTSKIAGERNIAGVDLHLEGRWQLESRPIDVGVQIGASSVLRRGIGPNGEKDYGDKTSYSSQRIMAVADWQFGRGKTFNPYAGLGAGVASNAITWGFGGDADFVFSPRIGVRCFNLVNVSTGYLFTGKEYRRIYFNLGFYF